MFVPVGVLGVGDDASAGDGGLGDDDGDVRVAGDDLGAVAEAAVGGVFVGGREVAGGGFGLVGGGAGVAAGEEEAEAFRG